MNARRIRQGQGRLRRALAVALVLVAAHAGWGQAPGDLPMDSGTDLRLKFISAPMDLLLDSYAEQTGRTLLLAPGLPSATITLRSQGTLTRLEYLEAIETVLGMNGIAILPEGTRFARVVSNQKAREEPMPIRVIDPETGEAMPPDDAPGRVSQMITLKHIDAAEAMNAIKPLQHSDAQAHAFEGINSVLLTDTASNVNRIMSVIGLIDQPLEAREEPIIVQILHAKASDIKAKLEQIVQESQEEEQKSTVQRQSAAGPPGVDVPAMPPGVIRARRTAVPDAMQEVIEAAERGLIQGKVKIIEDDRTNILILITRPENMAFFEKIIKVLDVQTDPDVMVKVFRLEYAEAKDIASMLNDLIGATSSKEDDGAPASAAPGTPDGATPPASSALREYVQRSSTAGSAEKATGSSKSKVGELSKDNVKILSDERTNALIIMASRSDLAALEEIIKGMDLMLSQVLVEAVIVEVTLDDSIQTGVDWVQRALVAYDDTGPAGTLQPKVAFAGAGGGGTLEAENPLVKTTPGSLGGLGSGLTYYLTMFDLNIDMVFKAVASDSRTRILSSPVILTQDNKDATIEVTQDQYFFKGQVPVQNTGGTVQYVEDVERQKVGIKLAVTPRINEKRFVVMEIEQTVEDVTGSQRIGDTDWPVVTSRKINADVAVRSGETIVLGGLVKNTDTKSKSGIPFLADIPLLGLPFRSNSKSKKNQEVIVFITPYVLDTPEEIMEDGRRRHDSMNAGDMWKRGWSDSKLAFPRPPATNAPAAKGKVELAPEARAAAPYVAREGSILGGADAPEPDAVPVADPADGSWDPMESLDPELRRYVEGEDKRWSRSLKRVDRKTDQAVGQPAE